MSIDTDSFGNKFYNSSEHINLDEVRFTDMYSLDGRKYDIDFSSFKNMTTYNNIKISNGKLTLNQGQVLNNRTANKNGVAFKELFHYGKLQESDKNNSLNFSCSYLSTKKSIEILDCCIILKGKRNTFYQTNNIEAFVPLECYSYISIKSGNRIYESGISSSNGGYILDSYNNEYQTLLYHWGNIVDEYGNPVIDKDDILQGSLRLEGFGLGITVDTYNDYTLKNSYEIKQLTYIPEVFKQSYPKDLNDKLTEMQYMNTVQTSVSVNGEKQDVYIPNTYVVDTEEEMNNLTGISDGDTCVVNKYQVKRLLQIGDNLKDKTLYFKLDGVYMGDSYYYTTIINFKNLDDNTKVQYIQAHNINIYSSGTTGVLWVEGTNGSSTETMIAEYNGEISQNLVQKIDHLDITDNLQVTSISKGDIIYNNIFVGQEEKQTFRYDKTKKQWINIEIQESAINGNIKKGNEEITVYKPYAYTDTLETNGDKHYHKVGLKDISNCIQIWTYTDGDEEKFYNLMLDDDVIKNVSRHYQFKFVLQSSGLSRVKEYSFNLLKEDETIYKTIQIPIGLHSLEDANFNGNKNKTYFYFTLDGNSFADIDNDTSKNLPNNLTKIYIKDSGYLDVRYKGIESSTSSNGLKYIILNKDGKVIENKVINDYLNISFTNFTTDNICIISGYYENIASPTNDFVNKLKELGCNKISTTTTMSRYLMISYKGKAIEYTNIQDKTSILLDTDTDVIMPIETTQEADFTEINSKITNLDERVSDIEEIGLLWMGKFDEGDGQSNFSTITRIDVDKITKAGGSLITSNKVLTFKAPYNGVYAFRGRVNFANSTSSGTALINIGSGYLLKETNISTTGGDTRLLYQNIPMSKGNTINISVSSTSISFANIFFEIYRY